MSLCFIVIFFLIQNDQLSDFLST